MTTHREEGEVSPDELMESSEADVPVPVPSARTTPRPSRRDPLIGATLDGRYEVQKLIARGGMGRIYAGEQSALGRRVALKVMDLGYSEDLDPDFQKRFFLEASTCAQLSHPNTIRIFDYGADGDICYIAMELIEGQTLLQAIHHDAPFEAVRMLHIARQICGSLSEAHAKGIIHRDLKPSNVLLTQHGEVEDFAKVLDFGLVKLLREDAQEITRSGLFLGSPNYMSPEQIRATGVDQRSDLYSLGVILFMALTGKAPFKRNTSINVLLAQLEEAPPVISDVVPDTDASAALQWTVMTCLEKSPSNRFSGVDELNRALKACESELRGELSGPLQLALEAGTVVVGTVRPGMDPYAAHGLPVPGASARSELPTVEARSPSGLGGHSLPPALGSSRQSLSTGWQSEDSPSARGIPPIDAGPPRSFSPGEGPSLAGHVHSVRRPPLGAGPITAEYPVVGPSTVGVSEPPTRGSAVRRRKRRQRPRWPLFALLGFGVLLAVVLVVIASQQEPEVEAELPELVELPEAVRVFSDPPGASVYKDGTFLGTTPIDLTVPDGSPWIVTLTSPGHQEQTVEVPPGIGSRRVQLRAVPEATPTQAPPRASTPSPSRAVRSAPPPAPTEPPPAAAAPPDPTPAAPPKAEPASPEEPSRIKDTRDPWGG